MSAPTPLSGIRVVEVGDRVAAAYCGKLLRDAGADVVKLERPGADPLRRYRPAGGAEIAPGADSPYFHYLAGGKRSVVVADGEPLPAGILVSADIVVLAAGPDQAARMGVDLRELTAAAPDCTFVTVSDFGWTGPWAEHPATEFTLQAWCGSTGSRGTPERPPISVGGDLGEFIAGGYAAFFGLAGCGGAPRGGHIDLSVLEAMTSSMQTFGWLRSEVAGLQSFTRSTEVPSIEPASDGYVGVSMGTDQQWFDFCAMLDCPELTENPELRFQLGRWRHRDLVRRLIGPWFRDRTVAEIVELAETYRIPMTAIGNGANLAGMSHFVQRGTFMENPRGFRQPRPPWLMSEASPAPVAPAPALGSADADQLWPARESTAMCPSGEPGHPLKGLRIIDLTAFWAGPAATQLFAALGADVIKVESIQRPDGMRDAGGLRKGVEEWWEYSWVFQAVNTDKKSVTLNLQSARGKELFGQLVAAADIVIENFPARVMQHLGLDYATLRGFNDRIIVVRMPAFGLDGPWRDRGGFAMTMEQIGGLAWLTGYDDDPPTAPRGPCDALAAVHAAFVSMCAVEFRRRTGRGQLVEVPMVETVLNATALQVIEHDVSGRVLTRRGNRGHRFAVQNVYACAGAEQWIALSVRDDDDWAALTDVLGRPAWAIYGRCATEAARWVAAPEIDQRLAQWFAGQPLDPTVAALLSAGVPAAPVVLPTDIGRNAQLQARAFLEVRNHPLCGPVHYPRPPVAPLPGRTHFVDGPAPTLGQHNTEVLCGMLGLTAAEVGRLEADGVIGSRPVGQ